MSSSQRAAASPQVRSSSPRAPQQQAAASPSPAASSQQQPTEALRTLAKTERIMRLELQRRRLKEGLRMNEAMLSDVDEQLAFVAQLKRDWLHHMRSLEVERKQLAATETLARQRIEEEMRSETEQVVFLGWIPQLRKLRRAQQQQQHAANRVRRH